MTTSKIATAFKTATFALAAGAVALGLASPADAAAGTMYGDPAAAAKYWRQQTYDDCVLMSAADVIGQVTGRSLPSAPSSKWPSRHPASCTPGPSTQSRPTPSTRTREWVPAWPTYRRCWRITASTPLSPTRTTPQPPESPPAWPPSSSIWAAGAVIVSINAEMIWGQPVEETDSAGNPRSDHAVVVTGVDTENGIVHLNDSGTPTGRDEQIPMETFVEAWATSHDFMAVTT